MTNDSIDAVKVKGKTMADAKTSQMLSAAAVGVVVGMMIGGYVAASIWRAQAIEAGVVRWEIDARTGDKRLEFNRRTP